ncbi:MAG: hypothetical protein UR78_C0001G0030 [Candidatus Moranbacteria bacterium GW2011_GWF2_35_39]|nr:MAG: hypothetical protein UR78_C0001G0030 [Candidatus Moranbacteria bacterium GW2011_GWF2_35_39]
MENPNFLKQKFNLHNAKEVKAAAKHPDEKIPNNPDDQIQNYLNRLENLVIDSEKKQKRKMLDGEQRPRALFLLREMLLNKYVRQNKEKMAEGAVRVEERAARELGIDAHYGEDEIEQRGNIAVSDLEKSLDNWITYLTDANESYPTWFRYYAFRSILGLGDYDKDKGEFPNRSQGTAKLFPDIDRGALAYIRDIIEAEKDPIILERLKKAQQANQTPEDQQITKEKAEKFAKLSFAKQYKEGIKQAGEITPEMREITEGKWVKYQKDTDPTALWVSLQNKGTAWCTKGFATAETQLQGGDFYVYYTLDKQGKPTIPRIAIRMQDNQIFETRGVSDNQQNLESNMIDIAEKKMDELPGKEKYKKTSADMKQLTEIEKKTKSNQELTKEELVFLYEIDDKIQGFGYNEDPRIKEIREQRKPNIQKDASIILECESNQIANKPEDINENTKAYIGELKSEIFESIQKYNIENIYTSFPEGKIEKFEMELGGRTKPEIESELEKRKKAEGDEKIYTSDYAESMLKKPEFFVQEKKEQSSFVKIKVGDLGFPNGATVQEIYEKAEKLGLELCPPETGPTIRLDYEKIFQKEQPRREYFWIAMKQIAACSVWVAAMAASRGWVTVGRGLTASGVLALGLSFASANLKLKFFEFLIRQLAD